MLDDPAESRIDKWDGGGEGAEKKKSTTSLRSYLSPDTTGDQHSISIFVNIYLALRVLSHGNS